MKRSLFFGILLITSVVLWAQVDGSATRKIRAGALQSHFTAYGSERAWTGSYYAGMIWPADYDLQDNAVIKRSWLACDNFTDARGIHFDKYGIYFALDDVGRTLFPMRLDQSAKSELPTVYVDGNDINSIYNRDIDRYDPDQIADRIVTNVVNTSMGLTMTRRIYAFSQQYHDNYFIKEFIFKNTGNADYDDEIELNADLKGVYVSWGVRYSVSRDGARFLNGQSWGKHTVVTRRGETYPDHYTEVLTESTPLASLDWLRAAFAWLGQDKTRSYDTIGSPAVTYNGRLTAVQHAGIVTLHVDKSVDDRDDDPHQPSVLGWHAGDTYPGKGGLVAGSMNELYTMLQGNPYQGKGGTDRFDETYLPQVTNQADPFTIHGDEGGTNIWFVYGPFDIPFGDSIRIVEAEGVSGLSQVMANKIGKRWKQAYLNSNDKGPFELPDGSTTDNKDVFKNMWTFTGKDSIMMTFSRAKRNFDSGMSIPQPPEPPALFDVASGGDKIFLSWQASPSESENDFGGYRIFRAVGKPDTTYQEIFACGAGTDHPQLVYEYQDKSPQRGFPYYYYIVAFNDGSNNTSGVTNPSGPLMSSRFFSRGTEPAFLKRQPGEALSAIRVVPNPYNISAREFNFANEPNKITFYNIPAYCDIKIYTERGDLIKTIQHRDGSGDASWDAVTSSRQVAVSGVYIAYIEVTRDYMNSKGVTLYKKGDHTLRKFVIIR
ncbi:MAG: fibronectin [Calditrichaeota bacterium]|nr:MAG: fibronectin [Calditrichota bacterium]